MKINIQWGNHLLPVPAQIKDLSVNCLHDMTYRQLTDESSTCTLTLGILSVKLQSRVDHGANFRVSGTCTCTHHTGS